MKGEQRRSASWRVRCGPVVVAVALAITLQTTGCNADRANGPAVPRQGVAKIGGGNSIDAHRGHIVSATFVRIVPKSVAAEMIATNKAGAAFAARYDVEQWSIAYTTIDLRGELVTASGGVFFPVGVSGAVPLVSFSHGTQTVKSAVASNPASINTHGIVNASDGSAIVVADYLGMGIDSAHPQAYLNAAIGAATSVDALLAAQRMANRQEIQLDGRLFVYGYSQGGQVAMALLRELERNPRRGLTVTAGAPMSGPYDLYGTAKSNLTNPVALKARSVSSIFAVTAAWQMYGIADRLDELLIPPYDEVGLRIQSTGMTDAELGAVVPFISRDVLRPSLIESILNNPDAPFSRAMRENETYDWAPRTPIRIYFATQDLQVTPQNARVAIARMRELGAQNVDTVNLGPLSHAAAQWPAFIGARKWFDSFPAPVTEEENGEEATLAVTAHQP
jgi:pimeloyl-ACP methyl ester carboxylesterase